MVGLYLYRFPTKAKLVTQKNLATCFSAKTSAEIEKMTHASLTNTASTILEMGKSWIPPMANSLELVTESEGEENFAATASEQGVEFCLLPT